MRRIFEMMLLLLFTQHALGEPSPEQMLKGFDKDEDGKISFEEILPDLTDFDENQKTSTMTFLKTTFEDSDKDSDGFISITELPGLMAAFSSDNDEL
eukprot:CAMPEP_0169146304 /NCGR_PEP_ID=MMETSP1015-20121227/47470_1 /TAXON_ID=342587 /ORGANISM="Karlodinium micrum, Strain CCMP2283" /LENGTH=96 /DNA_ID=CAMNT_0009214145 /DNA_START=39 /DNA_END=329 /DNA_ORIENTATION=-